MNEQILHSLEQYARSQGENVVVSDENGEMIVKMRIGTTAFEGRLKYVPQLTWEIYLWMYLPQTQGRFFIESKRNWFPEKSGCARVSLPPLDSKFKVHASDDKFLRSLLQNPKLIQDLMSFPEDSVDHLKIYLKDFYLAAKWRFMFPSNRAMREHRDSVLPARFVYLTEHLLLYYYGLLRILVDRGKLAAFTA